MEEIPDNAAEFIQEYIEERGDFLAWMGGEVVELSYDRAVIRLPFDDHLCNSSEPPIVHGGVTATLADSVGSLALRPYFNDPFSDKVATINLNVNYLRAAHGDLVARASVVRPGNSVGVSEIEVVEEEEDGEKVVAVAQGAYRVFQSG